MYFLTPTFEADWFRLFASFSHLKSGIINRGAFWVKYMATNFYLPFLLPPQPPTQIWDVVSSWRLIPQFWPQRGTLWWPQPPGKLHWLANSPKLCNWGHKDWCNWHYLMCFGIPYFAAPLCQCFWAKKIEPFVSSIGPQEKFKCLTFHKLCLENAENVENSLILSFSEK